MRRRLIHILFASLLLSAIPFLAAIRLTLDPNPQQFTIAQLSNFDLDQINGSIADIPNWIKYLDGKRVVIVGYQWNPRGDSARSVGTN